jgi:predicted DNA-binding protein YlxM (UPF0122 family)
MSQHKYKKGGRFQIPKEELERLYYEQGLTQTEIGQHYGCSKDTVCQRMKGFGLVARTNYDYHGFKVACQELHELYIVQELSTYEIAELYSCTNLTIGKYLRKCGIPTRSGAGYRIEIPREELLELHVSRKMTQRAIAKHYGCSQTLIGARLRDYGIPARSRADYGKDGEKGSRG